MKPDTDKEQEEEEFVILTDGTNKMYLNNATFEESRGEGVKQFLNKYNHLKSLAIQCQKENLKELKLQISHWAKNNKEKLNFLTIQLIVEKENEVTFEPFDFENTKTA